ncbi:MAG: DUF1294 domain-containing protein [Methanomicrobiaceae archaeon]|uniref:DUF1294 domain-containing protein n=1 Tax=hydrocarbon metagenome TaxID=938273 RepID=A0A0W8FJZ5_9ZZZZ|nr:DUF1294 domain-containing protein [Methanomicrobiaceae archaeon]MDD5418228.1 DUF1294 domain-containing protein [Methanomicrobiaceae archaeon]
MATTADIIIIGVIYALINGFAFLLFAGDKQKAKKNLWRTTEHRLLFAAVWGPFGAYAAMRHFRHKTQKARFGLVPVFAVLHLLLILSILARML